MNISLSKKSLLNILALVWLVFSLTNIFYDIWSDFKTNKMNQAYHQGKSDTINTLIEQAKQCNVIPVSSGTTTIRVINMDCLQSQTSEGE